MSKKYGKDGGPVQDVARQARSSPCTTPAEGATTTDAPAVAIRTRIGAAPATEEGRTGMEVDNGPPSRPTEPETGHAAVEIAPRPTAVSGSHQVTTISVEEGTSY